MIRLLSVISFFFLFNGLLAQNFSWVKTIEGSGSDYTYSHCVDKDGYVYTIGRYSGTVDLDPGPAVLNIPPANTRYNFGHYIQKLDSRGRLIWVKTIAAQHWPRRKGIAVDDHGNVYFT